MSDSERAPSLAALLAGLPGVEERRRAGMQTELGAARGEVAKVAYPRGRMLEYAHQATLREIHAAR
jgi:hypothetical protein